MHFTPAPSSWLNLVERCFRDWTDNRIRPGSFDSVPELMTAIEAYRQQSNARPLVFMWTAAVDNNLAKIAKRKEP